MPFSIFPTPSRGSTRITVSLDDPEFGHDKRYSPLQRNPQALGRLDEWPEGYAVPEHATRGIYRIHERRMLNHKGAFLEDFLSSLQRINTR